MTHVISVVGWHSVGKTTIVEQLIVQLRARGYRTATVKHTHGDFDIDHPGTDTWRFAEAGSEIVAIAGSRRLALVETTRQKVTLDYILERLPTGVDVVIVEGFKHAPIPKIEVVRQGYGQGRISSAEELVALVSDTPLSASPEVPCLRPHQITELADLVVAKLGKKCS